MLAGAGRSYIWDADNRLTTLNAPGGFIVSKYDYTGTRVEKTSNLGTMLFPFAGYQIETNGVIVKQIRIGIETYASKKSTGEKLFYHNDHLGGVNVITNTSGLLAQLVEYDPWGKISRSEGAGDSLRRFTGKELDPESGLYYYGGRYYDPELGRFISPDPFVPEIDDPQSHNRYSYVVNNPVNHIDPDGYRHERKKKKGGFFRRFFSIVRIIASIVLIAAGMPTIGADFGSFAMVAFGLANLGHATRDLAAMQGGGGAGPPGIDDATSGLIPALGHAGGGGFFSPALAMASEAGCDVCPDSRLDLLRVLRDVFGVSEAEAADTGVKPPPPWWPPRGRPGGIARPGGKNRPIEYRPPTEGQRRAWEDKLKQEGRKALEKSKLSIQQNLEKEYRKLAEIYHKGGYPNPVERTILRQQNDLEIIHELLK